MLRKRYGLAAGAIIAIGLVVSACSSTDEGAPVSSPPSDNSGGRSATTSPSAESGGGQSLVGVEPCSLLSAEELGKYGRFPPGETDNVGSSRGCKFQKERSSNEYTLVTSVGIRDQQGIKDAVDQGFGVDHTEANGRQFAQIPSDGSCTIAIGVTDSNRVDVYAGTTAGTQEACNIADEIAAMVEPKLPQG